MIEMFFWISNLNLWIIGLSQLHSFWIGDIYLDKSYNYWRDVYKTPLDKTRR